MNEWSTAGKVQVPGTKVSGNEPSRKRMVLEGKCLQCLFVSGTKVLGNERSRERMFQRMNSLENESSREQMVPRTKVPSWERMFQGTNSLENECSWYYFYLTCLFSRAHSGLGWITRVFQIKTSGHCWCEIFHRTFLQCKQQCQSTADDVLI